MDKSHHHAKSTFDRLVFSCINCDFTLRSEIFGSKKDSQTCSNCGVFTNFQDFSASELETQDSFFYKVKNWVKQSPKLFLIIGYLLGPLLPVFQIKVNQRIAHARKRENFIGINLGSGTSNYGQDIINVDFFSYKNVDFVADILKLPLKEEQFDLAILTEVVEHVPDPYGLIREIHRVLKPGGELIITSPFMIGFHGSPNDFQRFTFQGLKQLLSAFTIVDYKSYGPTGSMLWIFQEWCALWFSFGNKTAHTVWVLFFMFITSPLKILDLVLNANSNSSNIASTFLVIARK
jgi:SAM-dependent methyltransferase